MVAHRFGRFELQIFVIVFLLAGAVKKSKQIFDELPRTLKYSLEYESFL
jgi:hypothetical protein